MSHRGPRAVEVVLSAEERAELLRWAGGGVPARVAERARIILACADGASSTAVAADCGVSVETVRKWRSRFVARRLAGLVDEPRPGRRKPDLVLSEAERAELTRWARRAKTAQFLALRAKIVLRCAEGGTNKEVAAELGIAHATVNRWRSRFITLRLDGLTDEPRPGRPPSVLLDQVEDVLVATLESVPGKDTHWSRASMAKHSGLSKSTVGRIWKKFDLKPHLQDSFRLSTDPQFVAKVVDVVGLYHQPPEKAVVLCVDGKSQIQALDRSQPVLPMMPGMPERRTHDYYRHGITSLFAAFNIADGTVISELHRRHRAIEFKKFLIRIDKAVPTGPDVHLVCDNYATHNTAEIKTWLGKHPRFHVHFTPTGSSWMNQVERWFGLLTDKLIRRGVHTSVTALEKDITAWIDTWNENPKPFTWTKTADEILKSLADYLTKISPPSTENQRQT
ncbi:IS630 family transposase (plasmid) [Streptomyces sp. NBC_01591]|uniref:IS630 family transposase n=1 Tax=Streptomyces sp. NBC_01591 TaxID=2975888 RepID=UPI002DDC5672|nr:IS630 family transposase [Streptomyces sp. NBC_01591]WSD74431.1 IS630 family transposase [Streptomyces sp. NBC_01591]